MAQTTGDKYIGVVTKMQSKIPKWIAIKIERGFPIEVQGFGTKAAAEKVERQWRKSMNFDYDETGVLPLIIDDAQTV